MSATPPLIETTIDGPRSVRWVLEAGECKALAVPRIARLGIDEAVAPYERVRLHPGGSLLHERGGLGGWKRVALDLTVQRPARGVFQGQVQAPLVLTDLVDLDHVWVPQRGHRFGLAPQAEPFRAGGQRSGQQHLQGDQPIQTDLAGQVHDRRTAAAQLGENFVPRDPGPSGGVGVEGEGNFREQRPDRRTRSTENGQLVVVDGGLRLPPAGRAPM